MGHGVRFPEPGRPALGSRALGRLRALRRALPPARATAHAAARTGIAMGLLACSSAIVIASVPRWFSELIFGTPNEIALVRLLAANLLAVVGFHFFINLFTALRKVRLTTVLGGQQPGLCRVRDPLGAVLAPDGPKRGRRLRPPRRRSAPRGASGGWSADGACCRRVVRLRRTAQCGPRSCPLRPRSGSPACWPNLFEMADRYMIVHYLPATAEEAMAQVGNYHTSRVLPLLLVSVAALLSPLDHAAPEPRLGSGPPRPGLHAAESLSEAVGPRHVGRRGRRAPGGAAAIRLGLCGQVLRRLGCASGNPHLLRLARRVRWSPRTTCGAPRRPGWQAWPSWPAFASTWG